MAGRNKQKHSPTAAANTSSGVACRPRSSFTPRMNLEEKFQALGAGLGFWRGNSWVPNIGVVV